MTNLHLQRNDVISIVTSRCDAQRPHVVCQPGWAAELRRQFEFTPTTRLNSWQLNPVGVVGVN